MKNLRELAELVKNHPFKSTDFLTSNNAETKLSKPQTFYKKILAGDFQSDKEAAQFFFNDSNTKNSLYKNLKFTVRDLLVSHVFFIKLKKYSSGYGKAYIYCCKNLLAAKIIAPLGARNAGTDLMQKVFNRAIAYDLSEFIVESCKTLRKESAMKGDIVKFDYYDDIYKKYWKVCELETLSQEYYHRLVIPYIKSKANQEETLAKANQYYQELESYLERYTSPLLYSSTYLIKITAYLVTYDYQNVIETCKKAIHFFEAKPYTFNVPLQMFLHQQLICHTQLKQYEEGEKIANKLASLVLVGTYSWYLNKELHLILALHSKAYQKAYIILDGAIKHSKFKSLFYHIKERFLIHQGYIQFLVFINKIVQNDETKIKKMRLGKLLNSVPKYSKDKRGMHIPILILQILFMVAKKGYKQSIDRFEAIEKYCSRYLRKDDNLRSNCFIKMLLQIPKCYFHKGLVKRKTEKYYNTLLATPLDVARQGHEIEVIPYEDLWEMLIELLENRHYRM